MIKPLYAIKDVKTTFWKPFVELNEQSAVREFSNLINSRNEFTEQNYSDLELWQIGTYDDTTAEIVSDVVYFACGRDFYKDPVKDGANGR